MFYLDEFVEAKTVSPALHSLTDDRRTLSVDKLGKVSKATEKFMCVASYNNKYQSVSKDLKPSTKKRFVTINLGWPTVELETQIIQKESNVSKQIAEKLAKAAKATREMEKAVGRWAVRNGKWRSPGSG